jgi:hypothetical protein
MSKTFSFDAAGNMTVKENTVQMVDGQQVTNTRQHDISADQLAAHLVMFQGEMTPAQLTQAQAIIAAQGGA